MSDNDLTFENLDEMREEIKAFREILEENRLETYNPEYHLSKEKLADMVGVSINRITGVAKKWEERGIFEKVNVRYSNGRRGIGYVLLPGWKENLMRVLSEENA